MMAAGSAKVREMTWIPTVKVNAGHTSHGRGGMSTRNGANIYAIGENGRKVRKDVSVPSRD